RGYSPAATPPDVYCVAGASSHFATIRTVGAPGSEPCRPGLPAGGTDRDGREPGEGLGRPVVVAAPDALGARLALDIVGGCASRRSGRRRRGYLWMATGVPSTATCASSWMPTLSMRMQPWERALPSGSRRLVPSRPWMLIWPGPPSKCCSVLE